MNICLEVRYCGAPGSVGSLSKFFALPADMAPHLPDHISWEEAGSVQPLAVGVAIGIRADIRAHQTVAVMGCGPVGLIAAAVCRAYGVAKIIGFDIRPKRVAFAEGYVSAGRKVFDKVFLVDDLPAAPVSNGSGAANGHDHGHGVQDDEEWPAGDLKFEAAKVRAAKYLAEAGIEGEGVDRVIEASGAEDAGLLGIAIAKQGAVCKCPRVGCRMRHERELR